MEKWQNSIVIRKVIILSISILLGGWLVLMRNETKIRELDIRSCSIAKTDEGYEFYIDAINYLDDSISITEDYITCAGWLVQRGKDVRSIAMKVVFKNIDTNQYYIIPTTMTIREDVTNSFSDGYNYDNSGFHIKIAHNKLINTDEYDYEIFILHTLNGNTKLIPLHTTLKTWRD